MAAANNDLLVRVGNWLMSGDTGASSKAMLCHMLGAKGTGKDVDGQPIYFSWPSDPSDLRRCLRMLEKFPEFKARVPEMAKRGKYWKALVAHWDELAAMMAEEVGIDFSKGDRATKTFARMKEVLGDA